MASGVSKKELDVDELKVTSAVLMGAAHHYGTHCQKVNEEFMECRVASKDPRCCLEEGKQVTRCAVDFFRKVKGSCNEEFTAHWSCLDYHNQEYPYCRSTQKPLDSCMADKLSLKRELSQ